MRVWGLGLVVFFVLACAGSAGAATRYAAPNGGALGECTQATACSLPHAFEVVKAGEEVVIESGTYPTLTKRISPAAERVSVHGEFGAPMPIVHATVGEAIQIFRSGDTLKWIEIVGEATEEAPLECDGGTGIESVRVIGIGFRAHGIEMFGPCDVADSLAIGRGEEAMGIFSTVTPTSSEETIRNSTAIGSGPGAIGIDGFSDESEAGQLALEVSNTIASGDFLDLVAGGDSTVYLEEMNFGSSLAKESGVFVDNGGNQSAPPQFVDPVAGKYAEAAGSPTIDAGAIIPFSPTPTLDLAGNPRVIGGKIDIGAYEFVPPPPAAPGGNSSGGTDNVAPPKPPAPIALSGLKLTPASFHVAAKKAGKARGHGPTGTKVSFSLSAAAQVTFTVARKAGGRRVGGRCVKGTRGNATKPKCPLLVPVAGSFGTAGASGADTVAFSGVLGGKPLAPGAYRLTAKAGSATATADFKVLE